jgi:hypothetical protein
VTVASKSTVCISNSTRHLSEFFTAAAPVARAECVAQRPKGFWLSQDPPKANTLNFAVTATSDLAGALLDAILFFARTLDVERSPPAKHSHIRKHKIFISRDDSKLVAGF